MSLIQPLYKSILHLLGVNGLGYFVLLLISVIIFRTVDKSYYGLYVILISLFAIIELLMTGFNDSIMRFLKDKIPLKEKQNIVFFVICYKYSLILFFICCALIARKIGFFEFLIGNYQQVSEVVDSFLLVVILNGVISTLISINNCILNSQKKYKLTANIGLIRNIVYLIIVLLLSYNTTNYLHYLYASIILSGLILIFLSNKIYKDFNEFYIFSILKSNLSLTTGKKYIFPYVSPLTASSVLTYVKNHLPTLILGKEFSLENVAVFSILKTFFKALHSVSSSFVDPMMSKFLELKENIIDFSKQIGTIFVYSFLLRLILFAAVVILIEYIFLAYNIENSGVNQFIFYVLGIEFIIAGMILIYGIVLRLENNTKKVFKASLIRFAVELFLIYLILFDFGILAAALILLIARYIETLATYFFVRKEGIFYLSRALLFVFLLIILYFILQLFSFSI